MDLASFDAFKLELSSVKQAILAVTKKTLRDEALQDRIRTLYRTWIGVVKPSINKLLKSQNAAFKLEAELEQLARLTTKFRLISKYKTRIVRATCLIEDMALSVPEQGTAISGRFDRLFIPEIPDLPIQFAPYSLIGWKSKIREFLDIYPYDKSVFIMIRYRPKNAALISAVKAELSAEGLRGILASDHRLTDDLYNPIACLICCSKGIAIFDQGEKQQEFNPNVAYELAFMNLLNRQCLILKHESLKALHTDILMKLYKEYKKAGDARDHVREWILELRKQGI